jgi:hypothetical protein
MYYEVERQDGKKSRNVSIEGISNHEISPNCRVVQDNSVREYTYQKPESLKCHLLVAEYLC